MVTDLGVFGGEPVNYDPATDVVNCKNVNVFLRTLIAFHESTRVRATLDSKTTISRTDTTYKIGCLEDSAQVFNSLIRKAKNLKNHG